MSKQKKHSLKKLILKMTTQQRLICNGVINDFESKFDKIPGSLHNHQSWIGGYRDHVEEILNIACIFYATLSNKRKLDFTLNESLFVLFLHDLDKLYRYEICSDGSVISNNHSNPNYLKLIKQMLRTKYKYVIKDEELNALKYVHGEGDNYSSQKRVMVPLAAFVHCVDIISARIWYNKGQDDAYW